LTYDLHYLTIAQAARLIARRELSPLEYVDALLARISLFDPQVNAFITLTADVARQQARAAEAEIAAGRYRGPLHGIPFALKDIYDTAGILTSGGSRVCISNVPRFDATTTRMLYDAGMVLVGKLQTHEFAHGGPSFDLPWPPARNPWNLEHFTGGSSSGSAAAVAAGFVPASLGSDTGGSIRGPASHCGVVGLMPTFGLVSRAGVIPNSFTFDHCGPITRTVEDCAMILQAIAGYDPRDAGSIAHEVPDYRAALTEDLTGLRIGALRHYWERDMPASADLARAMDEAIDVFARLGARVEDCTTFPLQDSFDTKVVIGETEIYSIHYDSLKSCPGEFGRDFLGRVLPACLFQASDYVNAAREHRRILTRVAPLYDRYDVLLAAGFGPAPRLDAHRTTNFWRKASVFTPANVFGGPSLAVQNGVSGGLPLGMQLIGRPFDDATVLRAGHAYQQATSWHKYHPDLVAGAVQPAIVPDGNDPQPADLDGATRDFVLRCAQRAGLTLDDCQTAILLETAPFALAMAERIRRPRERMDEPSLVFRFPAT
jgi:aspartyl-tRNA(Asn)/glutamyl-tRNA(Gln) amidotransferase subunit A